MEQACAKLWGVKRNDEANGQQLLGTAFFISDSILITCKHAVDALANGKPLYVRLYVGHDPQPIKKVLRHETQDLAILELSQPANFSLTPFPLSDQERHSVPESGSVEAWGFTIDSEKCVSRSCHLEPYKEKYEKVGFTPQIANGYSGGPLIDEHGECVGVIVARNDTTQCGYAEPVYLLKQWMQDQGIHLQRPPLQSWQQSYLNYLIDQMQLLRSDALLQSLENNSNHSKHINLQAIYVPLCVDQSSKKSDEKERQTYTHGEMENELPTALQALEENRLTVLKGDPGCGKSTFTRYWALRLAMNLLDRNIGDENQESIPLVLSNAFPIHIELDTLYRKIPEEKRINKNLSSKTITTAILQYFEDEFPGLDTISSLNELDDSGHTILWLMDGLDEIRINDARREVLLNALSRWATGHINPRHRICLTTRPYAYAQNSEMHLRFSSFSIRSLRPEHCFNFIERLFFTLDSDPEHPPGQLQRILESKEREHLLELCGNPLLLTLTAVLFFKDGEEALPNDRGALYDLCIDKVLNRWERKLNHPEHGSEYSLVVSNEETTLGVPRERMHQALNELAYYAHLDLTDNELQQDDDSGDITIALLESHFFPILLHHFNQESNEQPSITQSDIEDYLFKKTGILNDRHNGRYAFMHRSFREYLAARYVATLHPMSDWVQWIAAVKADPGWWREVLALTARLCDHPTDCDAQPIWMHNATQLLMQCLPFAWDEVEKEQFESLLALLFAAANAEMERRLQSPVENETIVDLTKIWRKRLRNWLLKVIEHPTLLPNQKAEAGRYLGELGDPRRGTGLKENGLPDIKWSDVLPVTGSGEVIVLERIEETFTIAEPFQLSIYPITNQQFEAFLDHPQGYKNDQWWQGFDIELQKPNQSTWKEPNHPRTDVNWYEAVAFCRWLTAQFQTQGLLDGKGLIRLPYEWEWQYAATSTQSKWAYPWNDKSEYQNGRANIAENGKSANKIGRTTAAGIYHSGKSKQGIFDLIGNVWEWCANDDDRPSMKEQISSNEFKALRGGAWFNSAGYARAACRPPPPRTVATASVFVCCVCPHLGARITDSTAKRC